jgi:hypothetical protein
MTRSDDEMITGPQFARLLGLRPSSLRTERLREAIPPPDDPDLHSTPHRRRPRWYRTTALEELRRRGLPPAEEGAPFGKIDITSAADVGRWHTYLASVADRVKWQGFLTREGGKLTFTFADSPPAPLRARRARVSPYSAFRAELISSGRWGRMGVYPAEVAIKAAQRAITVRHGRGGWRLDSGHWETRLADGEAPGSRELWVRYVPEEEST